MEGFGLSKNPIKDAESKFVFKAIALVKEISTGETCRMRMDPSYLASRLGIEAMAFRKMLKTNDPRKNDILSNNNLHLIEGNYIVSKCPINMTPTASDVEMLLLGTEAEDRLKNKT